MTQKNQIYAAILVGFTLISVCMTGCPMYRVYSAQKTGEAELRRATYNRQIAVQEANAKKEAASSLADAEVIRAQGVAKANLIIGQSLKGNELYLHYLWLQTLEVNNGNIIYIPTSNQFPIMEAGRLGEREARKDTVVRAK
jgi:regulator of protease activity HflC (stomatin/prohibitin superfamily)